MIELPTDVIMDLVELSVIIGGIFTVRRVLLDTFDEADKTT